MKQTIHSRFPQAHPLRFMLGKWVEGVSFPNGAVILDRTSYGYHEVTENLIKARYTVVRITKTEIYARV